MRFPFNNFTYCLTLFSKCFSSFDHSTCSLSVSGQYLALDGIYHPLGAAFPNNSTRRRGLTRSAPPAGYGTLTLCGILFQGTWAGTPSEAPSANYNSEAQRTPDFKFELLPLHSPLLGQSRLVSFPPLIDMLKFSGYPRLIRGQIKSARVESDPPYRLGSANPCPTAVHTEPFPTSVLKVLI